MGVIAKVKPHLDDYDAKERNIILAAYNWGVGNVKDNFDKKSKTLENIPKQTKDYIKDVTVAKRFYGSLDGTYDPNIDPELLAVIQGVSGVFCDDKLLTITSGYGYRELDDKVHLGYDYRSEDRGQNPDVCAIADGKIINSFYDSKKGGGNMIIIDHGNGIQSRYAHLSKRAKQGKNVKKKDWIGNAGQTGKGVTGPHLDLKITYKGKFINYGPYISKDVSNPKRISRAR